MDLNGSSTARICFLWKTRAVVARGNTAAKAAPFPTGVVPFPSEIATQFPIGVAPFLKTDALDP